MLMKTVVAQYPVHQGYTCANRRILEYEDGSRVFAKTATNDETRQWLHKEYALYQAIGPQSFMAKLIGWEDDGEYPTLYLEDLSHARWPPSWHDGDVAQVLNTFEQIAQLPLQDILKPIPQKSIVYTGWEKVSADPEPFLSLGLCSESWLVSALPALMSIQQGTSKEGLDVVHRDLRSDNLCFADGRVVVIDWNWTSLSSRLMDIAFWLPSLQAEGGPAPEDVLLDPGPWAVNAAGLWASQAGLPEVVEAPRVRYIQKLQLLYALPWAARTCGLPPLDGDLDAYAARLV